MADGRYLEKIENRPYLLNGLNDQYEIWHDDANRPFELDRKLKFRILKNSRWRTAAIFKKSKSVYICLTVRRHDIGHGDAYLPSEPYLLVKFRTFKNSRWQTASIVENR